MIKNLYEFYIKIGQVTCFIPWSDLQKCQLMETGYVKILPGAVITGILLLFIYQSEAFLKDFNVSNFFIVFSTLYLCITSVYLNRNSWRKWICLYEKTNQQLKSKLGGSLELGWSSILCPTFYLTSLTIIRIFLHISGHEGDKYVMDIIVYIIITFDVLTIVFLSIIKKGFKILNKNSRRLISRNGKKMRHIISDLETEGAVICKNIFKDLYQLSICFNDLFGWLFVITMMRLIIIICTFSLLLLTVVTHEAWDFSSLVFVAAVMYRLVSKSVIKILEGMQLFTRSVQKIMRIFVFFNEVYLFVSILEFSIITQDVRIMISELKSVIFAHLV